MNTSSQTKKKAQVLIENAECLADVIGAFVLPSTITAIGADDEGLGNNQTDGNLMFPNQVAEVVLQSMGTDL